jgi:hypothetical protein
MKAYRPWLKQIASSVVYSNPRDRFWDNFGAVLIAFTEAEKKRSLPVYLEKQQGGV